MKREEFEDTKRVTRIRISKKNRQDNGQKKKVQMDKQRSTKHTHKTKDRVTRTPLKTIVTERKNQQNTVRDRLLGVSIVRDHVCLLAVSIVRDHVCLLAASTVRDHVCLLAASIARDHVCLLGVSIIL